MTAASAPGADFDVLVVGAGVAGLAAALELERRGREVQLIDAADEVGGVMRTDVHGGYRVERGPNSLLLKAPLWHFLQQSGLDGVPLRAAPASRLRSLLIDGQLVPVPLGPWALARSPLLSARGKLRLLREPFVPGGAGAEESVAEFITRRLGAELTQALVGPFLTGVYAGDERRLGAEAVFPALVDLEREHGSLLRGALARALQRSGVRGQPGTFSAPGGLGALAAALAGRLARPPLLHTELRSLVPEGGALRVGLASRSEGEREYRARAVVLATTPDVAARLVAGFAPEAAAPIGAVEYAPLASVALGAPTGSLRRPPEGFGFLVPRAEGIALLGCLFMSQLFADRAPAGHDLLHCMMGGLRAPEVLELDDAALAARAVRDLDGPLGVVGALETVAIRRWPRAVAQPAIGHRARIRAARQALAVAAPIALAGGYTDGVSVADAFASGLGAAAALCEGRG